MKYITLLLFTHLADIGESVFSSYDYDERYIQWWNAHDAKAQSDLQDTEINTTETLALVAGNKAKLEITVIDVALPVAIRVLFNNGSFEQEIGSTGIFDSTQNPGQCFLWRKVDAADEFFMLERLYCTRSSFKMYSFGVSFTYSVTTYPIDSRYRGTFIFKVGAKKNVEWYKWEYWYTGSRADHFLHKEILIVSENWVDPNSILTIQNSNPNYPFKFALQPNDYWVKEGRSTEISLSLSNFELPVFLLHKVNKESPFVLLYSLNRTRGVCGGSLAGSVLIREVYIKTCFRSSWDGLYTVQVTLKTTEISPQLAGEGFLAASYDPVINETHYQKMELARSRLRITTYTYACRAENYSRSTDVFAEQFGSSVFVNCTASCWASIPGLVIGLERDSPGSTGHVKAVCNNSQPMEVSEPAGKIVPDCNATKSNATDLHQLLAVFELRQFDQSMEGHYYCTVDDQGHTSSYPVSVYMQKYSTLTLAGVASNLFESIGQFTPLTCHALDGLPPAEITWLIGGEPAQLNATYYTQSLSRGNSTSILRLPMSHEYNGKDVICQTVPYGILKSISSNPIPINFYYVPQDVTDQLIDSNSSVKVTCNMFKSNPPIDHKNCTMSTFNGRDTADYDPIPDNPIIVEPGQSLSVRCSCKYSFNGRSATAQTIIYVNWKGAVNLALEEKIMRYISVYVLATIIGVSALLIGTLLILRLRGYSLDGPPLPDAIISKLAEDGEVVITAAMLTSGRSQLVIKNYPSGSASAWALTSQAGPTFLEPSRTWRSAYEHGSGAVADESAPAHSMLGTTATMLVSRGTMTYDGAFTAALRRTASGTSSKGSTVSGGSKRKAERKLRALAASQEAIAQPTHHAEAHTAAEEQQGRVEESERGTATEGQASSSNITS